MIKKFFKFILNIILLPYTLIKLTIKGFIEQVYFFIVGFKTLSLFLSRGFYFYLVELFKFIKKITHINFFQKVVNYFEIKKEEPSHIVLIIVWFATLLYVFDYIYVDNSAMIQALPDEEIEDVAKREEVTEDKSELLSADMNLYRIFNKYSLKDINISKLKEKNKDTVAWLIVEGTSINYPIVQTDNNDYYLQHSFDYSYTYNGWTFMDFRNDTMLNDKNTIFYGHNLLNGTAFGSLRNIFESSQSDIKIMVITSDNKKHVYKVFSAYYIDPEVYYLQTDFYTDNDYQVFLDTIRNRNIINVDNSVSTSDKIITLSTCTDDNNGRRVVHAKLVE